MPLGLREELASEATLVLSTNPDRMDGDVLQPGAVELRPSGAVLLHLGL
jgi:hypothetical protein